VYKYLAYKWWTSSGFSFRLQKKKKWFMVVPHSCLFVSLPFCTMLLLFRTQAMLIPCAYAEDFISNLLWWNFTAQSSMKFSWFAYLIIDWFVVSSKENFCLKLNKQQKSCFMLSFFLVWATSWVLNTRLWKQSIQYLI
jgi:hypothetical protein